MSLHHSPKIVSNGLILCLDAGKKQSYSGSGNIWRDLSGRDNHVTLYNSPTFSTADKSGAITFNGTTQYGSTNSNLITTNQFTIFLILKIISFSGSRKGYVGQNDFIEYGFDTPSNQRYYISSVDGGFVGDGLINLVNTWYVVCLTSTSRYGTQTNRHVNFTNGLEVINVSDNLTGPLGGSSNVFNIAGNGIWDAAGNFSNIKLAYLAVYNRGFDRHEVLQNYNALKGRFGL